MENQGLDFGVDLSDLIENDTSDTIEEEKETVVTEDVEENNEVEDVEISDISNTSKESQDEVSADQWFQVLKDRGMLVVDEDYEFDGSWETLEELDQQSRNVILQSAFQQSLEQLPEQNRAIIQAAFNGVEDLSQVIEQQVSLNKLDISNTDGQRKVLYNFYKQQGLDEDDIDYQLERLEDDDKLEAKAKQVKTKLEEKLKEDLAAKEENVKKQQEERKKEAEKLYNGMLQYADSNKWNPKKKQQVFGVIQNINPLINEIVSKPESYMQLAEILTYYNNGSFDLDAIRGTKTKKASTFRDTLAKRSKPESQKVDNKRDPLDIDLNWDSITLGV